MNRTPLHMAAAVGNLPALEILLSYGLGIEVNAASIVSIIAVV